MLFLTIFVFILAACNGQSTIEEPENTEETQPVDQSNANDSTSPENSEAKDGESTNAGEPSQSAGPSELFTQLESKITDRLSALYIPEVDYRDNLYDFGVLNAATRQYTDIAPMIGSGEVLNGYYEWYDPVNLQEAVVKAYGFTVDFEKYRNANEEEYPEIYYDGDFVYLISADFPGFNGIDEPIINAIEQFQDKPIYYTELQYKYFLISDYEQAGYEWDPSLWELPMDEWPEEAKQFIKLDEDTKIYAIFIDREDSFALAYYGTTPLTEDERMTYLENLQSIQ